MHGSFLKQLTRETERMAQLCPIYQTPEEPMDKTKTTLPPLILFGERVAIKPDDETVTKGGIIIPDTVQQGEEHAMGVVRYVGPGNASGAGVPEGKMRSKVGMHVKYYTLRAVPLGPIGDEDDLVVVNETDIIGAVPLVE